LRSVSTSCGNIVRMARFEWWMMPESGNRQ
jgi:hypothetical protein